MFFFSKLSKKNQKVLRKKRNKIVYPSHLSLPPPAVAQGSPAANSVYKQYVMYVMCNFSLPNNILNFLFYFVTNSKLNTYNKCNQLKTKVMKTYITMIIVCSSTSLFGVPPKNFGEFVIIFGCLSVFWMAMFAPLLPTLMNDKK
jgi:cellulose synthase/poly-beta-1,6-N-acetylglucosamine synthase-like glycosyltransferase